MHALLACWLCRLARHGVCAPGLCPDGRRVGEHSDRVRCLCVYSRVNSQPSWFGLRRSRVFCCLGEVQAATAETQYWRSLFEKEEASVLEKEQQMAQLRQRVASMEEGAVVTCNTLDNTPVNTPVAVAAVAPDQDVQQLTRDLEVRVRANLYDATSSVGGS